MGLDMYVYKVMRPNGKYTTGSGVELDEEEAKEPMYAQLLPYVEILPVTSERTDITKLRKDCGLSSQSYPSMIVGDYITYWDRETGKTVTISESDLKEKYSYEKTEGMYCCNLELVHYWRKEYDIQQWFHDNIGVRVDNCGFYLLDADLIQEFNQEFPKEYLPPIEPNEDFALYYHEWY